MKEAFQQAQELEDSIHERNAEAERLEETAEELKSIRKAEKEEKTAAAEKEETKEIKEKETEIEEKEMKDETGSSREEAVCVCPSCKASYGKKVNYCRLCGTAIPSDPD